MNTDFNLFYTVITRQLWRTKFKIFQPPHLYYVATLPSKTNTDAGINANFFWIMQQNKLVCIPMAEIFIYLFTAMLHDVTITSLLCLCKICYKTDVPASRLIRVTREREHFCRNVMVSVGVSRVGKTNMIFIDPSAKVNSSYYCRFVLEKGLLPDIQARYRQHKWTYQ